MGDAVVRRDDGPPVVRALAVLWDLAADWLLGPRYWLPGCRERVFVADRDEHLRRSHPGTLGVTR